MKKVIFLLVFAFLLGSLGCSAFAAEEEFVIACVGDSVTEGMKTTGGLKGPDAFPAVLEGLIHDAGLTNVSVKNFGKSATTAQKAGDVPYKESAEYRSSLKSDPDVVIIGLGANDSKKSNWDADRYEADYQSLILEYMKLESKPTVYLCYTTYVADQSKTGCQRSVIQNKLLPLQKTIAEDLGIKIIDLNTLTKKNADKYADGVHPNDELQSMMAEYIFNALCAEGVGGLSSSNATATVTMIDPAAEQKPAEPDPDTDSAPSLSTEPADTESAPSVPSTDGGTPALAPDYGWVLWVCIAAGVVLIGAVLLILLLRNKK